MAHKTFGAAVRRVSLAYQCVPEPTWPDVTGAAWKEREAAIDMAYRARDSDAIEAAVAEWEHHALQALEAAR